jgi:hypothetical protein
MLSQKGRQDFRTSKHLHHNRKPNQDRMRLFKNKMVKNRPGPLLSCVLCDAMPIAQSIVARQGPCFEGKDDYSDQTVVA